MTKLTVVTKVIQKEKICSQAESVRRTLSVRYHCPLYLTL